MTEQFANNARTTLNGSIDNSTTTVVVISSINFPTTGNFRIIIDNEIMLVTGVSGNTFTVTRSVENTTATIHASGATVTHILTAGSIEQFRADSNQTGSLSSLPTASQAGIQYTSTDYPLWFRDNGLAFTAWGPIFPLISPSTVSFSWVNQGSATETVNNNCLYLRDPGTSSRQGRLRIISTPTAPYTLTAGFIPYVTPGYANLQSGLVLYDSVGGGLIYFTHICKNPGRLIGVYKQNSVSSYDAQYIEVQNDTLTNILFFRIQDDNTNRYFQMSVDGVNFETLCSGSRTDWITPDSIGYFVDSNSSNQPVSNLLLSWNITQP